MENPSDCHKRGVWQPSERKTGGEQVVNAEACVSEGEEPQ